MICRRYIYDTILTIILSIIALYNSSLSLPIALITCDSISSALHFVATFVNRNLTEEDIVDISGSLYKIPCLDRYLWYGLCSVIYHIICDLFWMNHFMPLYWSLLFINLPNIQNKITSTILKNFFDQIATLKQNIIIEVLSKQISHIINEVSKVYLNKSTNVVKSSEIHPLFGDYNTTMNQIGTVVKNSITVSLILYLKGYSSYYYSLAKKIYNYNSDSTINTMDIESAKHMINKMCIHRNWNKILEPNFIQALIILYYDDSNNKKTNVIKNFITKFNYTLCKMFSIWTIAALFERVITVPVIGSILFIYRWSKKQKMNKRVLFRLIAILGAFILSFYTDSYFLVSLLMEFGHYIVFNTVTHSILRMTVKKSRKMIKNYQNLGEKEFFHMGSQILFGTTIHYVGTQMDPKPMVFLASSLSILLLSVTDDPKKLVTIITILLSGSTTWYNPVHIVNNTYIYYLISNYLHSKHFSAWVYRVKYLTRYRISRFMNDEKEDKTNIIKNKYKKDKEKFQIIDQKKSTETVKRPPSPNNPFSDPLGVSQVAKEEKPVIVPEVKKPPRKNIELDKSIKGWVLLEPYKTNKKQELVILNDYM